MTDNQGDQWFDTQVMAPGGIGPYEIILEATNGLGKEADIAIDEISTVDGSTNAIAANGTT